MLEVVIRFSNIIRNYKLVTLIQTILVATVIIASNDVSGQQASFDSKLRSNDPAPKGISIDSQIIIHQRELEKAILENDSQLVVFNYYYLIDDYTSNNDFKAITEHILLAENYIKSSFNDEWKGQLSHRKGLMFAHLKNYEDAIAAYELSLKQSTNAGDTYNMATTAEQLGALYGYQEEYEKSDSLFALAFELIAEDDLKTLAIALSNYGNVKDLRGLTKEASDLYKRAMEINKEIGNVRNENICRYNLAITYFELGQEAEAMKLVKECIKINKENNWDRLLMDDYGFIADLYVSSKDWENAYHFVDKYYILKDSLIGAGVQNEITQLQLKNTILNKDVEILQKESAIQSLEINNWKLRIGAIVAIFGFLIAVVYFLMRRRANRSEIQRNKNHIMAQARTLASKNARLLELELELSEVKSNDFSGVAMDYTNVFSGRILTSEDWFSFKESFENLYPNYIQRVRTNFPGITEAEERLFLLLKLGLKSNEIANILGILQDSVKKTRIRLRKKLELDQDINLEEFVTSFK